MPHGPTSPSIRPAAAVTAPITPMVIKMPTANSDEMPNARRVVIRPCWSMNPTMSGMLARWQGLSRMLRIPHTNAAVSATAGTPSTA